VFLIELHTLTLAEPRNPALPQAIEAKTTSLCDFANETPPPRETTQEIPTHLLELQRCTSQRTRKPSPAILSMTRWMDCGRRHHHAHSLAQVSERSPIVSRKTPTYSAPLLLSESRLIMNDQTSTTHLSGSVTTTYWPVKHRQTSFVPPEVAKHHIGMSLSRGVHSRSRELTVGFIIRPTDDSNIPQLMSGSQTTFINDDLRSLHAQPIQANQTASDAQMLVKAPQALPMIRPSTKGPSIRHWRLCSRRPMVNYTFIGFVYYDTDTRGPVTDEFGICSTPSNLSQIACK